MQNGFSKEKFIVYVIEHDGNIDIAERRVKTVVKKLKRATAGGFFNEECEPYNLKEDYTIITINPKTRIRSYDKKDKFIINLIETESNMEFAII